MTTTPTTPYVPLTDAEKETAVDVLLSEGLQNRGVLGTYISGIYTNIDSAKRSANDTNIKRKLTANILPEEKLTQQINAEHDKVTNEKLRPVLLNIANGRSAGLDMKEISNLVGAVSQVPAAFQGNGLGLITGVVAAISNLFSQSIVTDIVTGLRMHWSDGEKYPDWRQAIQYARIERSAQNAAEQFGVDGAALKDALTKRYAVVTKPPAPQPAPASPTLVPRAVAQTLTDSKVVHTTDKSAPRAPNPVIAMDTSNPDITLP